MQHSVAEREQEPGHTFPGTVPDFKNPWQPTPRLAEAGEVAPRRWNPTSRVRTARGFTDTGGTPYLSKCKHSKDACSAVKERPWRSKCGGKKTSTGKQSNLTAGWQKSKSWSARFLNYFLPSNKLPALHAFPNPCQPVHCSQRIPAALLPASSHRPSASSPSQKGDR